MLTFGSLAFLAPWALTALIALPAVWWLLRVTPPAPKREIFPALRLLRDLKQDEETSAHTPWWLTALRMLILAAVIIGLAQPVLNPVTTPPGSGPLVIVVDTGWSAARQHSRRQAVLDDLLDQAARAERPVVLAGTAPLREDGMPPLYGPMAAEAARDLSGSLTPQPWPADHAAVAEGLADLGLSGSITAVWLSDGLAAPGSGALIAQIGRTAASRIYLPGIGEAAHVLLPPQRDTNGIRISALRPVIAAETTLMVRLLAADRRLLGRQSLSFEADTGRAEATLSLPPEILNQTARLVIENESGAGAVWLMDAGWQRRPVGIITAEATLNAPPLMQDSFYLERALSPFSEVRLAGGVETLLQSPLSVIILADNGSLTGSEQAALEAWVRNGGVLIRFAGPRMAEARFAPDDPLLPVPLRLGDRALGGALSWSEPAPLAALDENGPLAGLKLPDDVTVRRQILAEPILDLQDRSWARLADGTPLITGRRLGNGWVSMVHTTAGPAWSDLSLSGFYVNMLRRLTELADGVAATEESAEAARLEPLTVLDGYGRSVEPPADLAPLPLADFDNGTITPQSPPGLYGRRDSRNDGARALNLGDAFERGQIAMSGLGSLPRSTEVLEYTLAGEQSLRPALLSIAMILALADLLISLVLRGLVTLPRFSRTAGAVLLALAVSAMLPAPASAQQEDIDRALEVTEGTWLAYVETGDPRTDRTSREGLTGLSQILNRRTSVDARGVIGVDVNSDELAFYPLLYWPVEPSQPPLSDAAIARLNSYLRAGGTVFFDTRDQQRGSGSVGKLREIAAGLNLPAMVPVPSGHVLTKAFYLLDDFPGRYAAGDVWVQNASGDRLDGVSPVIIGANDYAAAWAVDDLGRPRFPMIPGDERQREMARRFGVNLIMYVLTGNYKADQVHVPFILERLGQ